MKTLLTLSILLLIRLAALSQKIDDDESFLVIGTFRNLNNAERFVSQLNKNGLTAHYGLRTDLNLYYVYTKETSNKDEALILLSQIKTKPEFKSAWVFTGKLGSEIISANEQAEQSSSRPFSFVAKSKEDGKEVRCDILIRETDGRLTQWAKSGDLVFVNRPGNEHGSFTVTAMVPGYRMSTLVFFYDHPSIHKGPNNEELISLMLEPSTGENYIGFNHVRFLGGFTSLQRAAIEELIDLAEFLKANQPDQIIVHGYCTDKQQEEYTNARAISDPSGSKSLSLARAEMIKNFLVQQGVESSRIVTTGEDELHREVKYFDNHNRIVVEIIKSNQPLNN